MAFPRHDTYRRAVNNVLEIELDHDPHKLSEAFGKLIDDVPAPADRSDVLWAGTFLMRSPEAEAAELQDMIRSSGVVILREENALPKLEAIVARWRSLL